MFPLRLLVGFQQILNRLLRLIKFLELILGVGHPVHGGVAVLLRGIGGEVIAELLFRLCPLGVVDQVARAVEGGVGGRVVTLLRKSLRSGAMGELLGVGWSDQAAANQQSQGNHQRF